jgi:hypothetical protein
VIANQGLLLFEELEGISLIGTFTLTNFSIYSHILIFPNFSQNRPEPPTYHHWQVQNTKSTNKFIYLQGLIKAIIFNVTKIK